MHIRLVNIVALTQFPTHFLSKPNARQVPTNYQLPTFQTLPTPSMYTPNYQPTTFQKPNLHQVPANFLSKFQPFPLPFSSPSMSSSPSTNRLTTAVFKLNSVPTTPCNRGGEGEKKKTRLRLRATAIYCNLTNTDCDSRMLPQSAGMVQYNY